MSSRNIDARLARLEEQASALPGLNGEWEFVLGQRLRFPTQDPDFPQPKGYWRRKGVPHLELPTYDDRFQNPDGTPRADAPDPERTTDHA